MCSIVAGTQKVFHKWCQCLSRADLRTPPFTGGQPGCVQLEWVWTREFPILSSWDTAFLLGFTPLKFWPVFLSLPAHSEKLGAAAGAVHASVCLDHSLPLCFLGPGREQADVELERSLNGAP